MDYLIDLGEAVASIFVGLLALLFASFGLVSVFLNSASRIVKKDWLEFELVFFFGSLFFLIASFGLIWYGSSFFAPSLAPAQFMGTDFEQGLQVFFAGCLGIVFVIAAISNLISTDFDVGSRLLVLLIFGGSGAGMIWYSWTGLSDMLYGTGNLEINQAKIEVIFKLFEPFLGFIVGVFLLITFRDEIKLLIQRKLTGYESLVIFSYAGTGIITVVTSVLLFGVRVLHIEMLAGTADAVVNIINHYKTWKSATITIFEWGLFIVMVVTALIKSIFNVRSGGTTGRNYTRMVIFTASVVLAVLYVIELNSYNLAQE